MNTLNLKSYILDHRNIKADHLNNKLSAFYPHFICKNYAVHLHFGRRSSSNSDLWESSPKALREYKLIGSIPPEERIAGPVEPEHKRDCTGELPNQNSINIKSF